MVRNGVCYLVPTGHASLPTLSPDIRPIVPASQEAAGSDRLRVPQPPLLTGLEDFSSFLPHSPRALTRWQAPADCGNSRSAQAQPVASSGSGAWVGDHVCGRNSWNSGSAQAASTWQAPFSRQARADFAILSLQNLAGPQPVSLPQVDSLVLRTGGISTMPSRPQGPAFLEECGSPPGLVPRDKEVPFVALEATTPVVHSQTSNGVPSGALEATTQVVFSRTSDGVPHGALESTTQVVCSRTSNINPLFHRPESDDSGRLLPDCAVWLGIPARPPV